MSNIIKKNWNGSKGAIASHGCSKKKTIKKRKSIVIVSNQSIYNVSKPPPFSQNCTPTEQGRFASSTTSALIAYITSDAEDKYTEWK